MFGNTKERTGPMNTPTQTTAPQAKSSNKSNKNNKGSDAITAYLGPDTQIDGILRFENSVLIEGKFKGQIESEHGTLVIGESAEVEADIIGGHITVRGKVTGSITASERVHLQDRGIFSGELTTPSLQMDESVTFDGSCKMPGTGQNNQHQKSNHASTTSYKNTEDKILEAVDSIK